MAATGSDAVTGGRRRTDGADWRIDGLADWRMEGWKDEVCVLYDDRSEGGGRVFKHLCDMCDDGGEDDG